MKCPECGENASGDTKKVLLDYNSNVVPPYRAAHVGFSVVCRNGHKVGMVKKLDMRDKIKLGMTP